MTRFPDPIPATEGVVAVHFIEFASVPDFPGQAQPARMMTLLDEPGTQRLLRQRHARSRSTASATTARRDEVYR
jgi:hypothetical protein